MKIKSHASGWWTPQYRKDGTSYEFCGRCGLVVYDGKDKCPRGHERGLGPQVRKRQKRYSGYSQYQGGTGGFQQSSRA